MGAQHPSNQNDSERSQALTAGQLERSLSQGIQTAYRTLVGGAPKTVVCHLSERTISVVIEGSVINAEQLILRESNQNAPRAMRRQINHAFRDEIFKLVRDRIGVEASAVMIETSFDSGITGAVILLAAPPQVRRATRQANSRSTP